MQIMVPKNVSVGDTQIPYFQTLAIIMVSNMSTFPNTLTNHQGMRI